MLSSGIGRAPPSPLDNGLDQCQQVASRGQPVHFDQEALTAGRLRFPAYSAVSESSICFMRDLENGLRHFTVFKKAFSDRFPREISKADPASVT